MRLYITVLFFISYIGACSSPMQTQQFFANAVDDDPMLEPIHQTALYTVYFDHALRRCVLHSAYTWGESGGGTGGTGLGVTVFNCNPQLLKAHAEKLQQEKQDGTTQFDFPAPRAPQKTDSSAATPSSAQTPSPSRPRPSPPVRPEPPANVPVAATPPSTAPNKPKATLAPTAPVPPSGVRPEDKPSEIAPPQPQKTLQPIYQP